MLKPRIWLSVTGAAKVAEPGGDRYRELSVSVWCLYWGESCHSAAARGGHRLTQPLHLGRASVMVLNARGTREGLLFPAYPSARKQRLPEVRWLLQARSAARTHTRFSRAPCPCHRRTIHRFEWLEQPW